MRCCLKYCGGCNPRYDRSALVARLKDALGGGTEWVGADTVEVAPDFVLVVCGCTAACARHRELNGVCGKLVIHRPEQYDEALNQLKKLQTVIK